MDLVGSSIALADQSSSYIHNSCRSSQCVACRNACMGCCRAERLTTPCAIAGIERHGNKVLQPAVFTVDTLEAGSGEVLVYVEDPEGHTEEVSELKHSDF